MRVPAALIALFFTSSALAAGPMVSSTSTINATLSGDYDWSYDGELIVSLPVQFTFVGDRVDLDDDGRNGVHCTGWAKDMCWSGTFTTDDDGTGTFELYGMNGPSGGGAGNDEQWLDITYDFTGAEYWGFVSKVGANPWTGDMAFPSDTLWTGLWDESATAPTAVATSTVPGNGTKKASVAPIRGIRGLAPSSDPERAVAEADAMMSDVREGINRR